MSHISDMPISEPDTDLRSRLLARIESEPDEVWTPATSPISARAAVDKTLQRLAAADGAGRSRHEAVVWGLIIAIAEPMRNLDNPDIPDYICGIRNGGASW